MFFDDSRRLGTIVVSVFIFYVLGGLIGAVLGLVVGYLIASDWDLMRLIAYIIIALYLGLHVLLHFI